MSVLNFILKESKMRSNQLLEDMKQNKKLRQIKTEIKELHEYIVCIINYTDTKFKW